MAVDSISTILKAFREQPRPLFILVDSFGRWACLGILCMFLFRAPIVLRLKGDFFSEEKLRRRDVYQHFKWLRYCLNIGLGKVIIGLARGIIYNSKYLKSRIPVGKEKLTTIIHNPLHVPTEKPRANRIGVTNDEFVLLSVTNFNIFDKVMPILEEMINLPRKRWKDWNIKWYVCGDGPLLSKMRGIVEEKKLTDHVELVGHTDNVSNYYRACDVYVHFTRMDAFPNATLEAMFYKKPVVINKNSCGTVEQIEDGVNGFVIGGEVSFESVLNKLISDSKLRISQGAEGHRQVMSNFSIESQRKRFNSFIDFFSRETNRD